MDKKQRFLRATIYQFKTHISRYIHLLQTGEYEAIIIKRYDKEIGYFALFKSVLSDQVENARGRQAEHRSDDISAL